MAENSTNYSFKFDVTPHDKEVSCPYFLYNVHYIACLWIERIRNLVLAEARE